MPKIGTVGPDEAIERLNKSLAAVVRRHGESPEVREACHAAAVVRLLLGGALGGHEGAKAADSRAR